MKKVEEALYCDKCEDKITSNLRGFNLLLPMSTIGFSKLQSFLDSESIKKSGEITLCEDCFCVLTGLGTIENTKKLKDIEEAYSRSLYEER